MFDLALCCSNQSNKTKIIILLEKIEITLRKLVLSKKNIKETLRSKLRGYLPDKLMP